MGDSKLITKKTLFTTAAMLLLTVGVVGGSVAANADNNAAPVVRHLTGPVHPPQVNHSYKLPPNMDGCDRNYGVQHQCIPKDLPTGEAGCAYLTKHHFTNLKVVMVDDKKLDTNNDKIVCN